jgi:hypothetical protein
MRELLALSERIEHARLQLGAAEKDRLREGDALMKMWHQIRDRFVIQEQEIADYRDRIAHLLGRNEELANLVEAMLATIEASATGPRDNTAARIAGLAEELLTSEYPARTPPSDEDPAANNDEPEDVLELNDAAEEETDERFDAGDRQPAHVSSEESRSPGIRSLVSRFEAAMHRSTRRHDKPSGPELHASSRDDDFTSRDLELENLRHELSGLRRRMTDVVGAP